MLITSCSSVRCPRSVSITSGITCGFVASSTVDAPSTAATWSFTTLGAPPLPSRPSSRGPIPASGSLIVTRAAGKSPVSTTRAPIVPPITPPPMIASFGAFGAPDDLAGLTGAILAPAQLLLLPSLQEHFPGDDPRDRRTPRHPHHLQRDGDQPSRHRSPNPCRDERPRRPRPRRLAHRRRSRPAVRH